MAETSITDRARFDFIRYAQGWEDAEILVKALEPKRGGRFLSIAASGDNSLALLLLDPKEVVACDVSKAQLACLRLRIEAIKTLPYDDFIELMESTPSVKRRTIASNMIARLGAEDRAFFMPQLEKIALHGLGGIGKFEHYFRLFRHIILPFIARRKTVDGLLAPMPLDARVEYYEKYWNNWRWRLMTRLFFSRFMMGRLGRDPSFFTYAEGDLPKQIRHKVRHAVLEQEPQHNPYMQWILKGFHVSAWPLAWREEHYTTIRSRLDRLTLVEAPVEDVAQGRFDGFNLSDIFEYMAPLESERVYRALLEKSNPKARFVYWNMMVDRHRPQSLEHRLKSADDEAKQLGAKDKAFFYSAFRIEDAI